ncbi:UNVERIFIED_CONTAM: Nepetalactol-related short-chain-dehydrogenase/reductase 1 [Sesamum radiatum]|uniref:Nepetalactol-related short-chain-dehydrogenase/reductase 1 n=1 Tax=Sesamum radiatum TaxID=300843 RepID=A0AAW2WHM3_SESRA
MAATPSIPVNRKLEGKVAIVTGGANGIGETTARFFAQHGARVVIADIQAEKGRSVAESIGSSSCSYFQCDISDEEQVKSLVEWTVETYGGLDIMFANAAILSGVEQTILDLDFKKYDDVMRVNVWGTAACVKQAARKMIELGTKGAIVCSAAVTGGIGAETFTDYLMSKHAVVGLVRAGSQQLGVHGIRVNCVSMSCVVTPMSSQVGLSTDEAVDKFFGPFTSLKGVTPTTAHVADAVVFLASGDSAFISGHNLVVDGGLKLSSYVFTH